MSSDVWLQKEIHLQPHDRGFHLITDEVTELVPEIAQVKVGLLHLLLMHTSAGLTLNECVEPEVRADLDTFFNKLVPEGAGLYRHAYEGLDDMPAHIKSVLTGTSITLPIHEGRLRLGTWQGLYLCEFRNRVSGRRIAATLYGTKLSS